jgi:hypothetical protein
MKVTCQGGRANRDSCHPHNSQKFSLHKARPIFVTHANPASRQKKPFGTPAQGPGETDVSKCPFLLHSTSATFVHFVWSYEVVFVRVPCCQGPGRPGQSSYIFTQKSSYALTKLPDMVRNVPPRHGAPTICTNGEVGMVLEFGQNRFFIRKSS